jgi:methyltransferase (TIGR00027 family)
VTRTENDTWDIASSVGATAVNVAAARAAETASENPLINDPYAAVLLAGPELADLLTKIAAIGEKLPEVAGAVTVMIDYPAARTHFFDAFFTAAAAAGIRQHVILASGLDSRAYRLPWPDGTTVYEIDKPKVLEYKAAALAAHGAQPLATWREVPADLRYDWPTALREAGFDPALPTAWLAEGLLPFLTGAAQDKMFSHIATLSAPGSRIAVESFDVNDSLKAFNEKQRDRFEALRDTLGDDESFETGLVYDDEGRPEPAHWFGQRGWQTQSVAASKYLAQLGRPAVQSVGAELAFFAKFVTAEKPA